MGLWILLVSGKICLCLERTLHLSSTEFLFLAYDFTKKEINIKLIGYPKVFFESWSNVTPVKSIKNKQYFIKQIKMFFQLPDIKDTIYFTYDG